MTAKEIESLLKVLVEGQTLQIVSAVTILAMGLFAVFVYAYLKERGRNRGLKDDFEEIRKRVEESARITSQIQSEISRVAWVDQQRWEFRKDLYLILLKQLGIARDALGAAITLTAGGPEVQYLSDAQRKKGEEGLVQESSEASRKIMKEIAVRGVLFLSKSALDIVAEYQKAEDRRVKSIQEDPRRSEPHKGAEITSWGAHLNSEYNAAFRAYAEILAVAKKDLQLTTAVRGRDDQAY